MKKHSYYFILSANIWICFNCIFTKCEVTKDPITGDKVITANYKDRWVYMENKGENTKLAIVKGYVGELNISSPVGDEFIIKLDNDEVLNLKTSAVAAPNSYISQGVVYTNYTFETILDKATVAKLAAHAPIFIRFPDLKSGDRDWIDKKYYKAINVGAKFIMEN
ncbi:MAG: hypothetical protein IPN13_05160 [Bacteroidetes bacterium]|nr:hypothetical protein [Bacteroidota bacterium]